jgi:hypothetical protein
MEYKGVRFSVVHLLEGAGWRWEIELRDGKSKTGVTRASRAAAIKLAEHDIDRLLKEEK